MAGQALDLYEYRANNGRFPTKLAEAGPVQMDPYDGKPLRYKPLASGFLLYSVGQNGQDDGGKVTQWSGDGDVVFTQPTSKPGAESLRWSVDSRRERF